MPLQFRGGLVTALSVIPVDLRGTDSFVVAKVVKSRREKRRKNENERKSLARS